MNIDGSQDPVSREKIQRFLQLTTANQSRIHSYILGLVLSTTDADDLLQETTIVMWKKFDEFEPGTNFVAWALAIARYQILNYYRKQGRNVISLDQETMEAIAPQAEEFVQQTDNRVDMLKQCIQKLESKDKHMVSLRYNREMTVHTIAEMLGKKEKTIYKALARIQTILARCVRLHLSMEGL